MESQPTHDSQPHTLLIGSSLSRGLGKALGDALVAEGRRICFSQITPSAPVSGPFLDRVSPDGIAWVTSDNLLPSHVDRIIWIADFPQERSLDQREKGLANLATQAGLCEYVARKASLTGKLTHVLIVTHEEIENLSKFDAVITEPDEVPTDPDKVITELDKLICRNLATGVAKRIRDLLEAFFYRGPKGPQKNAPEVCLIEAVINRDFWEGYPAAWKGACGDILQTLNTKNASFRRLPIHLCG
jgi:hypothetical protein